MLLDDEAQQYGTVNEVVVVLSLLCRALLVFGDNVRPQEGSISQLEVRSCMSAFSSDGCIRKEVFGGDYSRTSQ